MKKACVVRTVNAGWWAVSYAGKNSPNKSYFSKSLAAHKKAVQAILRSTKGRQLYDANWSENADPLDTNPGYPFYTAQMDTNGNPVTRIKTVETFKNLVSAAKGDWNQLLATVDTRAGKYGMKGFPFCVAPLRRLQPGYKWQHQFTITPSGLISAFDERGVNSQRVAHMVPYAYNIVTAPVATMYKTARMLLPGCYHDGKSKMLRTERLKEAAKHDKLFLAEADYSNFDRFMAVDLIREIVSWFTALTPNPKYWQEAMMFLHDSASLVWPDFTSLSEGGGWLFKPGQLGLLSGVKATSDTGTLVNSVVNGEALARTMGWDEYQLYSYLTQYISAEVGSKEEYYYVQSDDTELIQRSPVVLAKHGSEFKEAVKAAGLKGSIELADRFLMRHLQDGADRPVPARVWQNTLSNEAPPASEIIFLAGLAARTDGLFGQKSVDPFNTGRQQSVTIVEAKFTLEVLKSIQKFLTTAHAKSPQGIEFVANLMTDSANIDQKYAENLSLRYSLPPRIGMRATQMRDSIVQTLARIQLAEAGNKSAFDVTSWIYGLYKDKNVPSSALLLDQLLSLGPGLNQTINNVKKKEAAFFSYASSTIGVTKLNNIS